MLEKGCDKTFELVGKSANHDFLVWDISTDRTSEFASSTMFFMSKVIDIFIPNPSKRGFFL